MALWIKALRGIEGFGPPRFSLDSSLFSIGHNLGYHMGIKLTKDTFVQLPLSFSRWSNIEEWAEMACNRHRYPRIFCASNKNRNPPHRLMRCLRISRGRSGAPHDDKGSLTRWGKSVGLKTAIRPAPQCAQCAVSAPARRADPVPSHAALTQR